MDTMKIDSEEPKRAKGGHSRAASGSRLRECAVRDPLNSECGSAKLSDLDFAHWWVDTSFGAFYLHVRRPSDETWHRVFCRHSVKPRIKMAGNQLRWIFPANANAQE